jgi:hypothetical protein
MVVRRKKSSIVFAIRKSHYSITFKNSIFEIFTLIADVHEEKKPDSFL